MPVNTDHARSFEVICNISQTRVI